MIPTTKAIATDTKIAIIIVNALLVFIISPIFISGCPEVFINAIATEDKPYTGIYSSNYFKDENSGFYISDDGTIIANQLTLGTSANIKKYIKLGENSWIINPSWLNNELSKENTETVVISNSVSDNKDTSLIEELGFTKRIPPIDCTVFGSYSNVTVFKEPLAVILLNSAFSGEILHPKLLFS